MDQKDFAFLIGCALGDGCIRKDSRGSTYTLVLSRSAKQRKYAEWQLNRINSILGSSANLKEYLDKGKYPAVRFGASNKLILSKVYDLVYFDGVKTFTPDTLNLLGVEELAIFWMDDGSLEVRKRRNKKTGNIKIERSAWLAVCTGEQEADVVGSWIEGLTGARYTKVKHISGRYYLRWHSAQCKKLIEAVKPYILPCVAYKSDLNRTCSVKEWLSESQHLL